MEKIIKLDKFELYNALLFSKERTEKVTELMKYLDQQMENSKIVEITLKYEE